MDVCIGVVVWENGVGLKDIGVSMMDGRNEGESLVMNTVKCEMISGGVVREALEA